MYVCVCARACKRERESHMLLFRGLGAAAQGKLWTSSLKHVRLCRQWSTDTGAEENIYQET